MGIPWATALRDEAHLEHNPQSKSTSPKIFGQARGHPNVWAVSGTPMTTSPLDFANWVKIIAKCRYNNSDKQRRYERMKQIHNHIKRLAKRYEDLVHRYRNLPSNQANADKTRRKMWDSMKDIIEDKYMAEIQDTYMLRRTAYTLWRGIAIAELPPIDKRTRKCKEIAPYWMDLIESYYTKAAEEQETTTDRKSITARKLRMMATIPGLAHREFSTMDMTAVELQDNNWYGEANYKDSPYYKRLRMLYKSSGKLRMLKRVIEYLVEGERTEIVGTEGETRPVQILISSAFPVISYIVWMVSLSHAQHLKI